MDETLLSNGGAGPSYSDYSVETRVTQDHDDPLEIQKMPRHIIFLRNNASDPPSRKRRQSNAQHQTIDGAHTQQGHLANDYWHSGITSSIVIQFLELL